MRGGHQMSIDVPNHEIWMYGGWDGEKDLGDLWTFSIQSKMWRCVSDDCSKEGGPSARSCHKICLDTEQKVLYTLGRFVDSSEISSASGDVVKSDFYSYDLRKGVWTLLSADVEAEGGPPLIYDHQMCVDSHTRTLYVFGGKIIQRNPSSSSSSPSTSSSSSSLPTHSQSEGGPLFAGLYRCESQSKNSRTHTHTHTHTHTPHAHIFISSSSYYSFPSIPFFITFKFIRNAVSLICDVGTT